MKYVIVGGGNIGTILAAELRRLHPNDKVVIVTSKKQLWSNYIEVYNSDDEFLYRADNIDFEDVFVEDGDIYFYTLPKQILKECISNNINCIKKSNAHLIFVPGTGGVEYMLPQDNKNIVVGMQRVPYISRIKENGRSVYLLSKKENIFVSTLSNKCIYNLNEILDIDIVWLNNYLEITLTPSNPILHTTRLYSMFAKNKITTLYPNNILFYEDWTDDSSKWLIACDNELQTIIKELKELNLSGIKPLLIHYESIDENTLTNKIRSIKAFRGLLSPMKRINENAYVVDLASRYFKEDFLYGLLIIKAIAQICEVDTPSIDIILNWYQDISGIQIINKNKIIINKDYNLPQNIGLFTKVDLYNFYKK